LKTDKTTREAVTWAYRLFLGREPESEAAVSHHLSHSPELSTLRDTFVGSAEFGTRAPTRLWPALHGDEPPRVVETDGDPELLRRLFDHVNRSWQHLGETDPYWSVLTAPQYRGKPSAEHIARFFASGEPEVDCLRMALARSGNSLDEKRSCLEYGCGLGRITRHLAPNFDRMIGVDISAAHLKIASELAEKDGVRGVEWLHLETLDKLATLPEVDLIYSLIVLQHNPPPVIERILSTFARILKPGGIAYFQVPTYRVDYEFRLADYVRNQVGKRELEMHTFPQERIFQIFGDLGAEPVLVAEDRATGGRSGERSNTMAFKKRTGRGLGS
jgi:SAM-dependent methyltransferase